MFNAPDLIEFTNSKFNFFLKKTSLFDSQVKLSGRSAKEKTEMKVLWNQLKPYVLTHKKNNVLSKGGIIK